MKLAVDQIDFNKSLSIISKALPNKATIPILSGILIESTESGIRLTASDLSISARQSIHAQVVEPGKVVLSGKDLTAIISKLPSGSVEISTNEKTVTIKSKHSKFELPVMSEDYPELTSPDGETFTVSADDLKLAIRQTIFATVPDDPRPFLSAVLWEISPDNLRMVATDVNRLAIREVKILGNVTESILVPAEAVKLLAGVFNGEITFSVNKKELFATGDGLTVGCRLLDAQYPKYEQVVPRDFAGKVIVNRQEFIKTLERAGLIAESVKLSIQDDQVKVSNKEADKGQFNEDTTAKQDGQPIEIGFNVKFLLDFLKAVDDDKIEFSYSASQRPVMAKVGDYQYVVMPLKLQ